MSLKSSMMQRCFDLARLGAGRVNPNPLVGAVLACEDRIIGEGYHAYYGGAHAEVTAVNSVAPADRSLLTSATLYVSLEPCNITGNTPPCTDLILREGIPRVIIAGRDRTPGVDGSGLARLRAAGVEVEEHFLEVAGAHLNRARNVFVTETRPYVMLKYAQSQDGFLAPKHGSYWITNPLSRRLVHRWRAETDAILVGKRTAAVDNPALTLRYAYGKQPLRLVIDRYGTLPPKLQLFDGQHDTWVFTGQPKVDRPRVRYLPIEFAATGWLTEILDYLYAQRISHLTVEGGGWLLEQFLAQSYWDEARIFTGAGYLLEGIAAPLPGVAPINVSTLGSDTLRVYLRPHQR
jgi:diaminohydroxyphosphoribosylaminopyrimidine deaminase/5-amino-6-(5-phosphoribosylamino)uracil reductase